MSEPVTPTESSPDDLAKIGFEPDDVPVAGLFKMAAALTVTIVIAVVGTYYYFDYTVANELAEKGYSTTDFVPADEHLR